MTVIGGDPKKHLRELALEKKSAGNDVVLLKTEKLFKRSVIWLIRSEGLSCGVRPKSPGP